MDTLRFDVRVALRSLRRDAGFALVALLTLGLGIGANTVAFSILRGTLLRAMPFDRPEALVVLSIDGVARDGTTFPMRWSWPEFALLTGRTRAFESVGAFHTTDVNLAVGALIERIEVEQVSDGYFDALHVRAAVGREFLPEEHVTPGTHPVVVLSDGLWQRAFGADSSAVGGVLRLNGVPLTVVGIAPPGFSGLSGRAALWMPAMMAPAVSFREEFTSRERFLNVIGRLRVGARLAAANAELGSVGPALGAIATSPADARQHHGVSARLLDDARIDPNRRRSTLLLFGAVWLVLLTACVNIASLLASRGVVRAREFAIRLAVGARRGQIVRQLLTESALLAVGGAVVGIVVAYWAAAALGSLAPTRVPTPANDYAQYSEFAAVRIDPVVLAFTGLLTVFAALLFGLLPAWRSSRPSLARDLVGAARGGAATIGSLRRPRLLGTLMVAQVALALVLVVGAGLLMRSLFRISARDVGVRGGQILSFWVQPVDPTFSTNAGAARIAPLLARIQRVPGVEAASVSLCTPYMATCSRTSLKLRPDANSGDDAPRIGRHYVGPDHFRVLGVPLIRGRAFTEDDREGRPLVTVISATAARRFWPNEDPIGKRVWFGGYTETSRLDAAVEIVGVVGDVVYWPVEAPPGADFYTPFRQHAYASTMFILRTTGDPHRLVPALRSAVREVFPDLPAFDFQTLGERAEVALAARRFTGVVLTCFAAAALLIASVGVYGVVAYSVAQRLREMGIRQALGATRARVMRHVLGDTLSLVLAGLALGGLAAWWLARLLDTLLYDVAPDDPATFALAGTVLLAAGILAALVPARRATQVDPAVALRVD